MSLILSSQPGYLSSVWTPAFDIDQEEGEKGLFVWICVSKGGICGFSSFGGERSEMDLALLWLNVLFLGSGF